VWSCTYTFKDAESFSSFLRHPRLLLRFLNFEVFFLKFRWGSLILPMKCGSSKLIKWVSSFLKAFNQYLGPRPRLVIRYLVTSHTHRLVWSGGICLKGFTKLKTESSQTQQRRTPTKTLSSLVPSTYQNHALRN
jgi:hypothetical protein